MLTFKTRVLNVISRWIKLQFQDFKLNPVLITRLEAFLTGDVNRAGFTVEADMIKEALDRQVSLDEYLLYIILKYIYIFFN